MQGLKHGLLLRSVNTPYSVEMFIVYELFRAEEWGE